MKRVYPLNIFGLSIISGSLAAKSYLTLETPQTIAYQAPLSMAFSRQEYWSGLPLPSPFIKARPSITVSAFTLRFIFPFTMLAYSTHSNFMCIFLDQIWVKNRTGVIVEVPASNVKP